MMFCESRALREGSTPIQLVSVRVLHLRVHHLYEFYLKSCAFLTAIPERVADRAQDMSHLIDGKAREPFLRNWMAASKAWERNGDGRKALNQNAARPRAMAIEMIQDITCGKEIGEPLPLVSRCDRNELTTAESASLLSVLATTPPFQESPACSKRLIVL
jgi:hypothetical protein